MYANNIKYLKKISAAHMHQMQRNNALVFRPRRLTTNPKISVHQQHSFTLLTLIAFRGFLQYHFSHFPVTQISHFKPNRNRRRHALSIYIISHRLQIRMLQRLRSIDSFIRIKQHQFTQQIQSMLIRATQNTLQILPFMLWKREHVLSRFAVVDLCYLFPVGSTNDVEDVVEFVHASLVFLGSFNSRCKARVVLKQWTSLRWILTNCALHLHQLSEDDADSPHVTLMQRAGLRLL
mmetsp:Transcript_6651/g.10912  ORF Transcript_6651/g.10912 Transcript_6651/m.10912 type:complete len:235 (+) Transcript_6651:279-983(+)